MTAHIPFILLTDHETPEVCFSCILSGCEACIQKPIDAANLWLQVGKVLARGYRDQTTPGEVEQQVTSLGYAGHDAFSREVRQVVEAHIGDEYFSVKQFAEEIALCHSQLFRKMRNVLGTTPSQFIRTVRLERSRELLDERDRSITEVAFEVGFNSVSYFTRCFRTHFGETPSLYRKRR